MTPETWTGSRWAVLPREHRPSRPHHCRDEKCCTHRIDAAEDAGHEWADMGADMDARAEREAW